jgi:hypothetical protein
MPEASPPAPRGLMPASSYASHRRYSTNSLEGQRGTLQTSYSTLHGDLGFRDRIHHFTWAWYTTTMSTGGIALVLGRTPHRFNGLTVLGDIGECSMEVFLHYLADLA